MKRTEQTLLLVLLVLGAAQLGWYQPRLPDPMGSSFGFDGLPSAWSTRAAFLWTHALTTGLTAGLFLLLDRLIRRTPARLVNIPHPEYWLSPGRRVATMARIGVQLLRLGCVLLAFLLWTFQLMILANLSDPIRLPQAPFWTSFVAFLGYSLWWTLRLVLAFNRVPEQD